MDYEHLARVGAPRATKTTKNVWSSRKGFKFVVTVVSRNPHFTPQGPDIYM